MSCAASTPIASPRARAGDRFVEYPIPAGAPAAQPASEPLDLVNGSSFFCCRFKRAVLPSCPRQKRVPLTARLAPPLGLPGRCGAGMGPGAARRHAARRRAAAPAVPLRAAFGARQRRGGPRWPGRTSPRPRRDGQGRRRAEPACGLPRRSGARHDPAAWAVPEVLGAGLPVETENADAGASPISWAGHGRGSASAPAIDAICIQEMGLEPGQIRACWNGPLDRRARSALSYLLTLASAGTIAGLLMIPARLPTPGAHGPAGIPRLRRLDRSEVRGPLPRQGLERRRGFRGHGVLHPPRRPSRAESPALPVAAPSRGGSRRGPWRAPARSRSGASCSGPSSRASC